MGEAVDSGMRGICGGGRVRAAGGGLYAAHECHCRAHAAGRGEGFVQRVPAGSGASRHARAGDGGNGALDSGLSRRRVPADALGEHGRERGQDLIQYASGAVYRQRVLRDPLFHFGGEVVHCGSARAFHAP